MHFSIRFGRERRETLEICVKVKEFPRLSFLPEGCNGKILDEIRLLIINKKRNDEQHFF